MRARYRWYWVALCRYKFETRQPGEKFVTLTHQRHGWEVRSGHGG